ncbi:MAG: hypothetical protein WCF84_05945 [Anaerolineae bacterium]
MNKKKGSKRVIPVAMTADDDLLPHYDLDYSKAKPNRFAGRPKVILGANRGGRRQGAGRPPALEPVERHSITLLKSDVEYLRTLDAKISVAVRKLIRSHKAA